jgi:hypothetical protein
LQIAILSNHLNGKDTHVHNIKIWSPKEWVAAHPNCHFD